MAYKRQSPQPVVEGGTGIQTATAYAPLTAGTTSTGAFQVASTGLSTSGFVLTSNGASALPSFQATSVATLGVTSVNNAASPYTVLAADQFLAVDSSGGAVSILLANAPTTGRVVYIKDVTASAATQDATKLEKELSKIEKYAYSGDHTTPEKEFLKRRVDAAQRDIYKNRIPVEQAWELKKDFNKLLNEPSTPKKATKLLTEMSSHLKDTLTDYGKINTEFGKNFAIGEDLYAGIHKASTFNRFLQDNASLKNILKKNKGLKGLFGGGSVYLFGAPKTAAGLGVGTALSEGTKAAELIYNSEIARKYYKDLVKSSLSGNVAVAGKKLQQLGKLIDHYDNDFKPIENFDINDYEVA